MAVFKFVLADPKTRKSYKLELDQDKAAGLVGKKIGDKFNGDLISLSGYEIVITGGTDKDGFPMHHQVHGMVRKKIVLSDPPCFHPKTNGMRKRKMVAGNTISKNITQVNCKIIKEGSKKLEELLGKKETPTEEAPKEEVKKVEPKKEAVKEKKEEEKKPQPEKVEPKKQESPKEPKKKGEPTKKEEKKK